MKGSVLEIAAFVVYLLLVLAVGIYLIIKRSKKEGGGRDEFLWGG